MVAESSNINDKKLLILKCTECYFQLTQEVPVTEMPDNSLNTNQDQATYMRRQSRLNTDGQVSTVTPSFATQL